MSFRSDFLKVLAGEKPDKFPATEFMMFWPECYPEYTSKAKTEDLNTYFGLGHHVDIPYHFTVYPLFERKVLNETEDRQTVINEEGIAMIVEKGTSAMPHYIDFPIKDRETFNEFKKRLDYKSDERVPDLSDFTSIVREQDLLTQITIRGAFAFLRDFIKFDELMYMFIDEPELIADMISFHTEFVIGLFGRVFEQFVPDNVYLGEDMAYKNSCMISPSMVEEFIYPAWKKIIDFCKSKGVKNVILDSDGYVMDILPIAIKAGFTAILPLERAAGMDGEKVKELYPELAMIGGVDKLELAKGKEQIDAEIEKAKRLFEKGRYIPSCDHSVPPIVSFENYSYYIENLKKTCI